MANINFRKINIEDLVEDKFADEKLTDFKFDFSRVRQQISGGQSGESLRALLANAPFQQRVEIWDKLEYLKLLAELLASIKDRETLASSLTVPQADSLIALIFRGMDLCAEYSQSVWLLWYETVVAKFGQGTLMRALTNRKRLL